ncbi:P-loop containing nucleoside triphosphate hydrolase protein [Artomyces pyxidatus]|uniref:P-loop containing nucleoside triphosphate hydrolase protein n=1 Tax=Artomyces pyxidatus TaxID=48021 RepID=A0ACB8THA8_9AGAM|nr:P-loop containing nucleoside triphosphate hydrolase protein [Artomyces pyxidatus]
MQGFLPPSISRSLSRPVLSSRALLPIRARVCFAHRPAKNSQKPERAAANRYGIKPSPSFTGLGLSIPVAVGLKAFQTIYNPTDAQREFIPAILAGKDVWIKGQTGTGKSFGLVLALLSKENSEGMHTSTSSLLIVPHRDLAYQFLHWIERLMHHDADISHPLSSTVQVLVRGVDDASTQVARLCETPPQIVIGTPQAILDVLDADEAALDVRSLSTVVVDEADYLVDYVPTEATKTKKQQLEQKIKRHPSLANQLLDRIFAQRLLSPESQIRCPQLIMCSATLHSGLRQALFSSGWFPRGAGNISKVKSEKSAIDAMLLSTSARDDTENVLGGRDIVHCVLVVSVDGEVKNIDGAVKAEVAEPKAEEEESGESLETDVARLINLIESSNVELPELGEEVTARFSMTPSPFDPAVMEGLATAFAVDVPSVALLVLPATAPVQRAVYDLRRLGVNACGLDLLTLDRGRAHLVRAIGEPVEEAPTMLVATLASMRGLDLPELSHVFILGVPDGQQKVDTYLHIAGRVGRFGRGGKVISILEERREVEGVDGKRGVRDEPGQLMRILKTLRVQPTMYEHFN